VEPLPGCQTSAIVNGKETPDDSGIHERQYWSIVNILYSRGEGCSGVFINRRTILTSAHCVLDGRKAQVAIGTSLDFVVAQLKPLRAVVHPTLDLALIFVNETQVPKVLVPISPLEETMDAGWVGATVEIAGFGLTETGEAHVRRFASTAVTELDETFVVVSSDGANGACEGDSGGPLVALNGNGSARVAGVLTAGHPSCLGHDRYVRVDRLASWLNEQIGLNDCGSVVDR
jgi:secreted trypsin-like serine protease